MPKPARQTVIRLEDVAWNFIKAGLPWIAGVIVLGILLALVIAVARKHEGKKEFVAYTEEKPAAPVKPKHVRVAKAQPSGSRELDDLLKRTGDVLSRFEKEIGRLKK